MQKFLLSMTAFGLLICSQQALAQADGASSDAPPWEYGLRLGANFNRLNQAGSTFGGNAGGFVRFNLSNRVALQAELLYDLQGGGLHPISPEGAEVGGAAVTLTNRRVQMHTVSLPLSVKYRPFGGESIVPYVLAGGNAQYIAAGIEVRDVLLQSPRTGDVALLGRSNTLGSDEIDPIQAGFHVGAGFDFHQIEGRVIGIELRYRQSLINVNALRGELGKPLRAHLSQIYSSTININFYATF